MKISNAIFALVLLSLWCPPAPARATIIPLGFQASINSGTLAGTQFQGTVAYDNAGLTGVGTEFVPLTTIDFVLDGVHFTRGDVTQGGQMLTLDGAANYFTASFFPAPLGSPVSDITFGFGGPGIIGTFNSPDDSFGAGTYFLTPISIPEPMTFLLFGAGLVVAAAMRHRAGMARPGRPETGVHDLAVRPQIDGKVRWTSTASLPRSCSRPYRVRGRARPSLAPP